MFPSMAFDLFGGRRLVLAGARLGWFWVAAGAVALALLVWLYREERRLVSRPAGRGPREAGQDAPARPGGVGRPPAAPGGGAPAAGRQRVADREDRGRARGRGDRLRARAGEGVARRLGRG